MYLQLFVLELQQNKKIATWKFKWIFNVVKMFTSNAHSESKITHAFRSIKRT